MCQRGQTTERTTDGNTIPDYPWQVVGSDLFELESEQYLIVDYFSRYPEIAKLNSTMSAAIISQLKSIFARHGIPEVVRSDNGIFCSGIFCIC